MDTLSAQQTAFVFGLGLFLLIALPLDYYVTVQNYGKSLAKRLMPNMAFVSVLIVLVFGLLAVLLPVDADTFLSVLFFAIAVFSWGRVIVLLFKHPKESKVLLDLGPAYQVSSNLILFFVVLGIGFILLALWAKHVYYVFWGLMVLAQAAWYYLRNGERALITDDGLQVSSNAIRWTRIKSFEWANEIKGKAILVVQLRKRPRLLDIQVVQIPAAYKDDTNRLLVEHVVRSPTV